MTSSTHARAKTLGFRSLVVLGGTALAVSAVALPSKAAPTSTPGFTLDQAHLLNTQTSATAPGPLTGLVPVPVTDDVPTGSLVELTVTSTGATGSGYVVAYPEGNPLPGTADLGFSVGRTVSSTVLVPVVDGVVDLYVAGSSTQLIVDQQGFFDASALGATSATSNPTRVADSRKANDGFTTVGPQLGLSTLTLPSGDFTPGEPVALNLGALPSGTGAGYVTAYTPGTSAPATGLVGYNGLPTSNLVIVTPNSTGQIALKVAGRSANIVVDLEAIAPKEPSLTTTDSRIADSRSPGLGLPVGPLKPGSYQLTIPAADVPAGTTGVILNIASIGSTANGYLSVSSAAGFPGLQFLKGTSVGETVVATPTPVTSGSTTVETVTILVSGASTNVIVDTEGYVTSSSSS